MITVTAFKWVPPFAQGLVRDLRVRWALEEAGLPYDVRLIGPEDQNSPAYRAEQPYGQVPVIQEDGLELFESGAIVLHIAEKSPALLPTDPNGRARAIAWMFSALNSIEPWVQNLVVLDAFYAGEEWSKLRKPGQEEMTRRRLHDLSVKLGDKEYLEGRFTAGDLLMATVLRNLRHTDIVTADPRLGPYLARCEARPAFKRALAAQMAVFEAAEAAA
jgi:glutathione S-transferase